MKLFKTSIKVLLFFVMLSAIAHAGVDDGYVPAHGDLDKENVSAPLFTAIGYGVIWSAFVIFLLLLYRRMKLLSDKLKAAEERLRKLETR